MADQRQCALSQITALTVNDGVRYVSVLYALDTTGRLWALVDDDWTICGNPPYVTGGLDLPLRNLPESVGE